MIRSDMLWHSLLSRAGRIRPRDSLLKSTVHLEAIISSAMDAIISIDSGQRVVLFNPAAEKMFGISSAEAIGEHINRFIPERYRSAHVAQVAAFGQTGVSHRRMGALGTISGLRANGQEFPIEASISNVQVHGEKLYTVILRDITHRQKAEAALRESEARFRELADAMPQIVWTARPDGCVDYYNKRWYEFTGLPENQHGNASWLTILHPDDANRCLDAWDHSVHSGEPFQTEYRMRARDTGEFRWHLGRALPVRDSSGGIVRWFGTSTDIDDQKRIETALAEARDQLEEKVQQRTARLRDLLDELEHFSYSITHDMRAPLRTMHGFITLMEADPKNTLSPQSQDFLQRIKVAAHRMDQLIVDSLNYSKIVREELPIYPVDVLQLLRGIVQTYPNLQPPHADITFEGEFPAVLGNEAGLTQCFSNLLGNGVKFVAPGTQPKVRVWAQEMMQEDCRMQNEQTDCITPAYQASSLSPQLIRLWFEDNGIGIPKSSQASLFGMFTRLSQSYEGTGIGLAIVRKAAERMGGSVGVESEPGQGSRFWLELKLAPPNPPKRSFSERNEAIT